MGYDKHRSQAGLDNFFDKIPGVVLAEKPGKKGRLQLFFQVKRSLFFGYEVIGFSPYEDAIPVIVMNKVKFVTRKDIRCKSSIDVLLIPVDYEFI